MNSRELAKELKIRAKLKSASAAESLVDNIVAIMTERLEAGENVSISRLGTFRALQGKRPSPEPHPRSTPKPIVQFHPYCAFEQPDKGTVGGQDDERKYKKRVRGIC